MIVQPQQLLSKALGTTNTSLGDGLGRLLIDKWRWSYVTISVAGTVWYIGWQIIIALISRMFLPGDGYRGLLADPFVWVSTLILVPALWVYYAWLYRIPLSVIEQLEKNGSILSSQPKADAAVKMMSRRYFSIIAIMLTLLMCAINYHQGVLVTRISPIWWNAGLLQRILIVTVASIPNVYIGCMSLLRILHYKRFFKIMLDDIAIQPLHPDGAGGLGSLGSYAFTSLWPLAIGGSVAAFSEYWVFSQGEALASIAFHVAIAIYIIAAVYIFIPIWHAHRIMIRARQRLVLPVSHKFDHEYPADSTGLEVSTDDLEDKILRLGHLQKLHEIGMTAPVWPFDTTIFRRFRLAIVSPAITFVATALIDFLFQRIFDVSGTSQGLF